MNFRMTGSAPGNFDRLGAGASREANADDLMAELKHVLQSAGRLPAEAPSPGATGSAADLAAKLSLSIEAGSAPGAVDDLRPGPRAIGAVGAVGPERGVGVRRRKLVAPGWASWPPSARRFFSCRPLRRRSGQTRSSSPSRRAPSSRRSCSRSRPRATSRIPRSRIRRPRRPRRLSPNRPPSARTPWGSRRPSSPRRRLCPRPRVCRRAPKRFRRRLRPCKASRPKPRRRPFRRRRRTRPSRLLAIVSPPPGKPAAETAVRAEATKPPVAKADPVAKPIAAKPPVPKTDASTKPVVDKAPAKKKVVGKTEK